MVTALWASYVIVFCLCVLSWFFAGGDVYVRNTVAVRLWMLLTSAWLSVWFIVIIFHFAIKYW